LRKIQSELEKYRIFVGHVTVGKIPDAMGYGKRAGHFRRHKEERGHRKFQELWQRIPEEKQPAKGIGSRLSH
jgi:hypothetical protein